MIRQDLLLHNDSYFFKKNKSTLYVFLVHIHPKRSFNRKFLYICIMGLTSDLIYFIEKHANDDPNHLLLSASRYPGIDMPFAVEQLIARKQIREKLPEWYANKRLIFPAKITAEQCSSEQTARYKQRLIEASDILCDLTGGLGIDSYYFSQKAKHLYYMERFENYCEAARNNFTILGANNITVRQGDATSLIDSFENISLFYIDPARRGESNKRVFALADCEPDLVQLLPRLWKKAPKVIAKISPMADIKQTLSLLPETTEVHVLSVKNECKELLFVLEEHATITPSIYCVNLLPDNRESIFYFTPEEEGNAPSQTAQELGSYLYEPNASLLKAGAFKQVATAYGVEKLAISSHLYTSKELKPDFPGRIFNIEEVYPFSNKLCKEIGKRIPKANITTRNFPLSVEDLRKKTKIKEGGSIYLFATTLSNGEKILIRCAKKS